MRVRNCKRGSANCFSDIGMSSNFWVRAWFLLSLSRGKSYGYELIGSIPRVIPEESLQSSSVMGNYYRILRMLEQDNLITSEWDTTGAGPARRIYSITPQGVQELELLINYIKQTKEFVDKFVNYIAEEVK